MTRHYNVGINNPRFGVCGSNVPNWKGDDVGYDALHTWVRRNLTRPKLCQTCLSKQPYDVANISGRYLRDLDDWKWLCRSCHVISDGRIARLHSSNRGKPLSEQCKMNLSRSMKLVSQSFTRDEKTGRFVKSV